jgi:hypothetical protein
VDLLFSGDPIEQVEEGGIGGPALESQPQRLAQLLPMPPGKSPEITGAAAAAQDPQLRFQQQDPPVVHPTAVMAMGDGLEEADQVSRNSLIDCRR